MKVFVNCQNRYRAINFNDNNSSTTSDLANAIVKAGYHSAQYTFSLFFQDHPLGAGNLKTEGIKNNSIVIARPTLTSSIDLQCRTPNNDVFIIEVLPSETISSIINKIADKTQFDANDLFLVMNSKVLNLQKFKDSQLQDSLLKENDIVYIITNKTDLPTGNLPVYITFGSEFLISLTLKDSDDVSKLKETIAKSFSIPVANQQISYNGKLANNHLLNTFTPQGNFLIFSMELVGNIDVTFTHNGNSSTQTFDSFSTIADIKKKFFQSSGIPMDKSLQFEGIICDDNDALFSFYRIRPTFMLADDPDNTAIERVNTQIKAKADANEECYSYIYANMLYNGIVVPQDTQQAAVYFDKACEQEHLSAMADYAELIYANKLPSPSENAAKELSKKAADKGHVGAMFFYGLLCYQEKNYMEAKSYLLRASNQGHVVASTLYAKMILKKVCDVTDITAAADLLETAASKKYPPAMTILAHLLKENGKKQKAQALIDEAATLGSPGAIYSLATKAIGDDNELENGAKFAAKAAKNNHRGAKKLLGVMKRRGVGTQKDINEAFSLLEQAADKGDEQAQFHLAKMYLRGDGCQVNEQKAFQLVSQSADKKYPASVLFKANMLLRGIGCEKDPNAAYQLASTFAGQTQYIPCIRMKGVLEMLGVGTEKNLEIAANDLHTAAQSDKIAMYYYALLLKSLDRFPSNRDEVIQYLKRAADMNHHDAEEQLGFLLLDRTQTTRDNPSRIVYKIDDALYTRNKKEALTYFKKAAKTGRVESMYNQALLMLEFHEDEKEAARLLELCCQKNHPYSFYHYSCLLEEGRGVDKNLPLAQEYLQKAADFGVPEAQYKLAKLLLSQGKTSEALPYLRNAANANIVPAMYDLAQVLKKEDPVAYENEIQEWLEKAALQGHVDAAVEAANYLLAKGEKSKAFNFYKIGALGNNPEGMFHYAKLLEEGDKNVTIQDLPQAFTYYKKSAEMEYVPSMYELGRCYANGIGTDKDPQLAMESYENSANHGDPNGMVGIGHIYNEGIGCEPNLEKACDYFEQAAKKDSVEGHYMHGYMLDTGRGVDKDQKAAYDEFKIAADHGNHKGEVMAARDLLYGIGTERNMDEGREYLMKAIAADERDAHFELGNLLDYENDQEGALKEYQLAAEKGHVQGMLNAALLLVSKYEKQEQNTDANEIQNNEEDVKNDEFQEKSAAELKTIGENNLKKEVESDQKVQDDPLLSKATNYLRASAEAGDVIAQLNLGLAYAKGRGVVRDGKMADKYLRLAAESQIPEALYNCGVFLVTADGALRNEEEGREMLQKASDDGYMPATFNLGTLLLTVEPTNIEKGLELLKKAADEGYSEAYPLIASYTLSSHLYDDDATEDENVKLAAQYAKKGADNGDAYSICLYGSMLANGLGVEKDELQASNYFKKASDLGNVDAMYNYGVMLFNGIAVPKDESQGIKLIRTALKCGHPDALAFLDQNVETK